MARREQYHHGSLREALLQAALAILEADGAEELTLRKVAARVGVSHAAPAHHFPALKDLLTALAAIGFQLFDRSMRDARAAAPATAEEQLRAAAQGIHRFRAGAIRRCSGSCLLRPSCPGRMKTSACIPRPRACN